MKSGVSGRGGGSAKAMNILSGVMSRLIVRSIRPRTPTLTIILCGVRGLRTLRRRRMDPSLSILGAPQRTHSDQRGAPDLHVGAQAGGRGTLWRAPSGELRRFITKCRRMGKGPLQFWSALASFASGRAGHATHGSSACRASRSNARESGGCSDSWACGSTDAAQGAAVDVGGCAFVLFFR